jgi:hypothetical protein
MKIKLPSLTPAPPPESEYVTDEKLEEVDEKNTVSDSIESTDVQKGVQAVQGAAQLWTKNQLILAYFL